MVGAAIGTVKRSPSRRFTTALDREHFGPVRDSCTTAGLNVVEQLKSGTMPPKEKSSPGANEAKALTDWIDGPVVAVATWKVAVIDDDGTLRIALRAVEPTDGHAIWAAYREAPADSLDGLLAQVVDEVRSEMRSRFAPDGAPAAPSAAP